MLTKQQRRAISLSFRLADCLNIRKTHCIPQSGIVSPRYHDTLAGLAIVNHALAGEITYWRKRGF